MVEEKITVPLISQKTVSVPEFALVMASLIEPGPVKLVVVTL
jgi:hypothetical protein